MRKASRSLACITVWVVPPITEISKAEGKQVSREEKKAGLDAVGSGTDG